MREMMLAWCCLNDKVYVFGHGVYMSLLSPSCSSLGRPLPAPQNPTIQPRRPQKSPESLTSSAAFGELRHGLEPMAKSCFTLSFSQAESTCHLLRRRARAYSSPPRTLWHSVGILHGLRPLCWSFHGPHA